MYQVFVNFKLVGSSAELAVVKERVKEVRFVSVVVYVWPYIY